MDRLLPTVTDFCPVPLQLGTALGISIIAALLITEEFLAHPKCPSTGEGKIKDDLCRRWNRTYTSYKEFTYLYVWIESKNMGEQAGMHEYIHVHTSYEKKIPLIKEFIYRDGPRWWGWPQAPRWMLEACRIMLSRARCWLPSALRGPHVLQFRGIPSCLHKSGSWMFTNKSKRTWYLPCPTPSTRRCLSSWCACSPKKPLRYEALANLFIKNWQ